MRVYVTDTHPLIWYSGIHHKGRRLSPRARAIFRRAEAGLDTLIIPAVVLWEISLLHNADAVRLPEPFDAWVRARLGGTIVFEPVTLEVLTAGHALRAIPDPFDRLIVGTALACNAPLVTADRVIIGSNSVRVVW